MQTYLTELAHMEQKAVMQKPTLINEPIKVPTFLKWAGGKQQILSQFSKYFPKKINHYVEPFLGGGSVLFYVLKYRKPAIVRAYDINQDLIDVYNQVKAKMYKFIEELRDLEKQHNSKRNPKKFYYQLRNEFNKLKKRNIQSKKVLIRKSALFIYLNKTCYNGLFRVNSHDEFNVPCNGVKKLSLFNEQDLLEANNLLQNAQISKNDFREIDYDDADTIYFDPPYWADPVDNGFTAYSNEDFNCELQEELANLFDKLSADDQRVFLSNSDKPFIHKLYPSRYFKRRKIFARRMINCDGQGRGQIAELLITSNR